MKVYLVVYTRYNSWREIKERFNMKVFKNRARANHYMATKALDYARDEYAVSLVKDGVYINNMKAERKHTKICEEVIIEITVKEMEVI